MHTVKQNKPKKEEGADKFKANGGGASDVEGEGGIGKAGLELLREMRAAMAAQVRGSCMMLRMCSMLLCMCSMLLRMCSMLLNACVVCCPMQCPVLIYGRVLRVRYAVSSTELGSGYAESGTERGSGGTRRLR